MVGDAGEETIEGKISWDSQIGGKVIRKSKNGNRDARGSIGREKGEPW